MSALDDIEQLLSGMSRAEKAQVLQWVVRDLGDAFPGIESHPDITGGEPCIARTRIPVWVLVQARQFGTSESDLLRDYPALHAEDLVNAWGYARAHRQERDFTRRAQAGRRSWDMAQPRQSSRGRRYTGRSSATSIPCQRCIRVYDSLIITECGRVRLQVGCHGDMPRQQSLTAG